MVLFKKWLQDESGWCFMRHFRPEEHKIYFPKSFYRTWEEMISSHVLLEDSVLNRFSVSVSTDDSGNFMGNGLNEVRCVHKYEGVPIIWFKILKKNIIFKSTYLLLIVLSFTM